MKYVFYLALSIVILSCDKKAIVPTQIQGEAQGTYYAITYFDEQSTDYSVEIDFNFESI